MAKSTGSYLSVTRSYMAVMLLSAVCLELNCCIKQWKESSLLLPKACHGMTLCRHLRAGLQADLRQPQQPALLLPLGLLPVRPRQHRHCVSPAAVPARMQCHSLFATPGMCCLLEWTLTHPVST